MQRQNPESRHRRKQPPRWIALVVALGVVGIAAFLLFSDAGPAKDIREAIGGAEPVPEFAFDLRKASAEEVTAEHHKELDAAAQDVAASVSEPIDLLYTAAFLDPNNWKDGDYQDVWAVFDERAGAAAQEQADVLTLGPDAGATYRTVEPDTSKLSVNVLFDADGQPASAVAVVSFRALATATGGGSATAIVSKGHYFLEDLGDGWRVVAFDVDRADRAAAVATPSGSASVESS